VDYVIVRFLMKLFNTMDIINNCRQHFDVKLPTLWSDRVRRFEKKFADCDNIFLNFSLNSISYIYLLVKPFLSRFFCFFHVYLLPVMVNKDVIIII